MSKAARLAALAQEMQACTACKLAASRTQVVVGSGSPTAEVVFIGEAPGKREDLTGKPFVGAAGKWLDTLFASIGWSREQVYIANVVKCRPPDNRDPKPVEAATCWPYLAQQLEIIAPRLIVTLGRHSLMRFHPEAQIGQVHGQLLRDAAGQAYLPLYHPAAALYSPATRETQLADFAKLPSILRQLS
jgi:DNA polymerase